MLCFCEAQIAGIFIYVSFWLSIRGFLAVPYVAYNNDFKIIMCFIMRCSASATFPVGGVFNFLVLYIEEMSQM